MNLPPSERPRREILRWANTSSGKVARGLPSRASKVREVIPRKALLGSDLRRLNPRSKTYNILTN